MYQWQGRLYTLMNTLIISKVRKGLDELYGSLLVEENSPHAISKQESQLITLARSNFTKY